MKNQWKTLILIGLIMVVNTTVQAASSFTFVVLGDRTGGAVPGVYEQVLDEVAFLSPDFMITVGDHIEGYETDSVEIETEWDYVLELLNATGVKYHLTPGNHDIWDDQSRAIYERRFGSRDKAFNYKGSLFVIIDVSTQYTAQGLPAERLKWLEGVLKTGSDFDNVFVFYHKPFWCEDFTSGRPNFFHELFKRYGVSAVFTGHYHRHFYTERDGIRYFSVSSSGGSLPRGGRQMGSFYAYLLARIVGDSLTVGVVEPDFMEPVEVVTVDDVMALVGIEQGSVSMSEIEVDQLNALGINKVTVSIENRSHVTLRDTATWVSRGGWSVEPAQDYVEVPPGEVGMLTAFATNDGQVFPVPVLRLNVPHDDDSTIPVEEPLLLRRVASAHHTEESPQLDGLLNEAIWGSSGAVSEFFGWRGEPSSGDSTFLKMCYDRDNLYVGIECMDNVMAEISAGVEDRDGFIRDDDNFSILLEPVRGSQVFYQVYVNPIGTIFDQMIEICPFGTWVLHPEWDAPLEVATQVLEDRWIVELAIPLAALGVKSDDDPRWGFNFMRWHRRLDAASAFQPPVRFDSDRMAVLRLE
ncbi:MAG: metallophosphoesterase [Candidatus Eisenbacteria bacterium]